MKPRRPRLAFVSPVFLFPADTGGRIRTTNILRGLKGGAFDVVLIGPATADQVNAWVPQIASVCDRFVSWQAPPPRPRWRRVFDLLNPLPVNVVADRVPAAIRELRRTLTPGAFDVVVFDFVHAAVLRPARLDTPTVCFTHNVEAEIFDRHAAQARNASMRAIWSSQAAKMRRYEAGVLPRFTTVVAVSQRDAAAFRQRYGVEAVRVIPTGVDLDYFAWIPRAADASGRVPTVVFTGSMDWAANVDGVGRFLADIWPRVRAKVPSARFVVVGRDPPAALVERARLTPGVTLTGFVDDVRPYVRDADVFVIPLRVGGGTRIKAFEAMAMGCPVVSTSIGIEGLGVNPDEHYVLRDDPEGFADAVVTLLGDPSQRHGIATRARRCVETHFGHRQVAQVFERACLDAMELFQAGMLSGSVPRAMARP